MSLEDVIWSMEEDELILPENDYIILIRNLETLKKVGWGLKIYIIPNIQKNRHVFRKLSGTEEEIVNSERSNVSL